MIGASFHRRYARHRTMSEITYLKITCERCGGHIEYPSEMAGRSIQCPHCQHSITLPPRFVSPPVPFRFVGVVIGPCGVWIDPQNGSELRRKRTPLKSILTTRRAKPTRF